MTKSNNYMRKQMYNVHVWKSAMHFIVNNDLKHSQCNRGSITLTFF